MQSKKVNKQTSKALSDYAFALLRDYAVAFNKQSTTKKTRNKRTRKANSTKPNQQTVKVLLPCFYSAGFALLPLWLGNLLTDDQCTSSTFNTQQTANIRINTGFTR
jgi:hypothetical protein